MINHVNARNMRLHEPALDAMFRDRKRIFVDILGWEVPVDGPYERDQFDNEHAEYLIVCDPVTREHFGSMRLLCTDRPNILGDLFPMLCEDEPPSDPAIWELTRLCLSPRLRARDRLRVRNRLFTNLVEYALLNGIKAYTGVAHMSWYAQLLALGWRCTPLGLPQEVNGEIIAAAMAHIEPNTIELFRQAGTYDSGEMRLFGEIAKAA